MHNLKEITLYKQQGQDVFAYSDASAGALVASDLAQVLKGSSIEPDIAVEPIEIVAGGFDQFAAVVGKQTGKGSLKFAMNPASSNGSILPQWGKVLVGSCDFSLATTSGGTNPSNFVMTPINQSTNSGEIWHYTGDASASSALLSKFYNCKGSWKISANANKAPEIEFTLTGAFQSEIDATQPAATDLSAIKIRETVYAVKNATVSIMGSIAYKLLSFDAEGGETIVNRDDISVDSGSGQTDITDRKIKFSLKCYAIKKASADALGQLLAGTEAAISIAFGPSGKSITIGGTYAQITERKRSDENGIAVFDIKGQFNRNDFTVRCN
jgi:hypothetical protein